MSQEELRHFVQRLSRLSETELFDPKASCSVARAPGRLDVMGGIADYSGSLVLEMPIHEAAFAAAQRRQDGVVSVASLDKSGKAKVVRFPLAEIASGEASSYEKARAFFKRNPGDAWVAYVAGVLLVLRLEKKLNLEGGMRLLLASDVPEGKGVSSSAAIEVATMRAVAAELGLRLKPSELATLCQKVENLVVGAPCGVMDQMTSACGEEGKLLELLCQPAQILGQRPIPEEVTFFGIDSGVRHAVTGADYGQVRVGAFIGYRLIAELEGMSIERSELGAPPTVHDALYGGYLANVTPALFGERYLPNLPKTLSGHTFLDRYGATTDAVTRIDPDRIYPVSAATAHPVFEHFRVRAFSELLSSTPTERVLELLGELMYQSHASYGSCGLGAEGTDQLVKLVREAGASTGVFGAKITGGGSGGTVAVLARAGSERSVEKIATRYSEASGREAYVFRGSSPGAAAYGVFRYEPGRENLASIEIGSAKS